MEQQRIGCEFGVSRVGDGLAFAWVARHDQVDIGFFDGSGLRARWHRHAHRQEPGVVVARRQRNRVGADFGEPAAVAARLHLHRLGDVALVHQLVHIAHNIVGRFGRAKAFALQRRHHQIELWQHVGRVHHAVSDCHKACRAYRQRRQVGWRPGQHARVGAKRQGQGKRNSLGFARREREDITQCRYSLDWPLARRYGADLEVEHVDGAVIHQIVCVGDDLARNGVLRAGVRFQQVNRANLRGQPAELRGVTILVGGSECQLWRQAAQRKGEVAVRGDLLRHEVAALPVERGWVGGKELNGTRQHTRVAGASLEDAASQATVLVQPDIQRRVDVVVGVGAVAAGSGCIGLKRNALHGVVRDVVVENADLLRAVVDKHAILRVWQGDVGIAAECHADIILLDRHQLGFVAANVNTIASIAGDGVGAVGAGADTNVLRIIVDQNAVAVVAGSSGEGAVARGAAQADRVAADRRAEHASAGNRHARPAIPGDLIARASNANLRVDGTIAHQNAAERIAQHGSCQWRQANPVRRDNIARDGGVAHGGAAKRHAIAFIAGNGVALPRNTDLVVAGIIPHKDATQVVRAGDCAAGVCTNIGVIYFVAGGVVVGDQHAIAGVGAYQGIGAGAAKDVVVARPAGDAHAIAAIALVA